jgi:uncharacterized protein YbcC (UPF0753/DUF2309 family)
MIASLWSSSPSQRSADVPAAVAAALARIPPLWPLEHFVAVNPFLGLTDRPFPEAARLLQHITGAAPLPDPDFYRKAWWTGAIDARDLAEAANEEWTAEELVAALESDAPDAASPPLSTFADLLDRARPSGHWRAFVVEEISKWCAVHLDDNQTTWTAPWKNVGLYPAWRAAAVHDHNPAAAGLRGFRSFVATLPADPDGAIDRCLGLLQPDAEVLADFFHRQLVTVAGWAGHIQYRVREDALRGRENEMLKDLLAIRLAYDAALFSACAEDSELIERWRRLKTPARDSRRVEALARWQLAYEAGYQRRLARALTTQPPSAPPGRPLVQAVFCIDVRSEVFRRQLERALPQTATIGFAGFFGFPVAHRTEAGATPGSRCPVLLVPPVESGVPLTPPAEARAHAARAAAGAWKAFQNSATSCFSFVESVGLGFGFALGRATSPGRLACTRPSPAFAASSLASRAQLAAGALKNMSLTKNFARLILICGHGSESANNPYASGLDCGACGGHAGDVNARLAAATLNDSGVRSILSEQGLTLPADTVFLAGLHNTATDDVTLFDLGEVPATHREDLVRLQDALKRAGAAARRERAPALGLAGLSDKELDAAVDARAHDIAEVRPEWGLANNAAFVAAPRSRTAGLQLDGRVFLHDYVAASDPDDRVLNLILSAPVVVASWINLQYYASRVDPARYGAGNKVLHNVVGGIGVQEGNGGDLKVGLPLQSLHNGKEFVHEPRRLAVYIEADPARIRAVLERHRAVHQLFAHDWLHLFSLWGGSCFRYREGRWSPYAG